MDRWVWVAESKVCNEQLLLHLTNDTKILSQPDNWQAKFTRICQDIRDIKSNKFSKNNKIREMTITPTNSRSTKVLDNHKPLGYDKSEGDDLGASDSPYTPSLERTRGRSPDT